MPPTSCGSFNRMRSSPGVTWSTTVMCGAVAVSGERVNVGSVSPSDASRNTRGRMEPCRSITASTELNSDFTDKQPFVPHAVVVALGSRTSSIRPSPDDRPNVVVTARGSNRQLTT